MLEKFKRYPTSTKALIIVAGGVVVIAIGMVIAAVVTM